MRCLLGGGAPEPAPPADWPNVRREGLLGVLADAELTAGRALPPDVRDSHLAAVAFELRCRHVLAELGAACTQRGFPLLVFKGCSLATTVYPRPGLRSFGDLDVAVPPESQGALAALLVERGYRPGGDGTFVLEGLSIDVHEHPLQQLQMLVGPSANLWWERLESHGPAFRLAFEHEFVLGLLHGAKHAFSRAYWLLDLALLAAHADPACLAEAVRKHRAQQQLSYAAACLERWFGWSLPEELTPRPRWNLLERRFMHLVLERRAKDYLGMLTPVSSAYRLSAALRYLRLALYPPGLPFARRSRELLDMLVDAWQA